MALHQYIGARYVPKFYENSVGTAEWRSGVIYEPLTIVTWNGNSYTSKRVVPANIGDPSLNPDYWVATGIFNDQLQQIQDDVTQLHTDLDDLTEDLSPVLHPRHFILIADSYGGIPDTSNTLLLDKLAAILEADYYAARYKSGIGFTNVNNMGTFLEELQAVTVPDADAITDILVIGGANDFGNVMSDIEAAIDTFMTYATTTYKNAKVYIAHVGNSRNNRTAIDKRSKCSILAYRRCALYGAHYLNNTEYTLHSTEFLQNDGVHPTAAGIDLIETSVAEAYVSGAANIRYSKSIAPVFNTGQSLYTNPSIAADIEFVQVEIDNGVTSFSFKGGQVLEISVPGGTVTSGLVTLYNLPYKLVVGTTTAQYGILCMAEALGSGGSILGTFPCIMYVDDNGNISIFNRAAFLGTNSGVAKLRIALIGNTTIPTIDC